jgi:tetratricopeptide (TPR) repeat protein
MIKFYFHIFEKNFFMRKGHIIPLVFISVFIVAMFTVGCKSHKYSYGDGEPDTINALDFYHKGEVQFKAKLYKEALGQYNKAIQLDSTNGNFYFARGLTKYHLKDYYSAINDYDKTIKLIPNYGEVFDARGIARGEIGDSIGSCEDFNKAYELGYNDAFKLIEKFCLEEVK